MKSVTVFSFPAICLALKSKFFNAAIHVSVIISFMVSKHLLHPRLIVTTVARLSDRNRTRLNFHDSPKLSLLPLWDRVRQKPWRDLHF